MLQKLITSYEKMSLFERHSHQHEEHQNDRTPFRLFFTSFTQAMKRQVPGKFSHRQSKWQKLRLNAIDSRPRIWHTGSMYGYLRILLQGYLELRLYGDSKTTAAEGSFVHSRAGKTCKC